MINNILDIEILTPDGFKRFDGIVKSTKKILKVVFENTTIRCTLNHKFYYKNGWIEAKSIKPGLVISNSRVISVTLEEKHDYVYDPVNVSDNNSYITNGIISHNCSFIGSSATLVDGAKLAALPRISPTHLIPGSDSLRQYHKPEEKHSYVMLVDTARGKGLDYSAFSIVDITSIPYKVVCVYRNNTISTLVFPEVIERIANIYNDAFVLIETNDLGQQVADILFYDLEYENVYMSADENISEGGGNKKRPGLRTTKRTKAVGCDILKGLIENDKLILNDSDMISELTTFIRIGNSYKADDGKNDDLAMTLVMFAYLTNQTIFKDLFDYSLREKFFSDQLAEIDDQFLPLGYFDRGEVAAESVKSIGGWIEGNDDNFVF